MLGHFHHRPRSRGWKFPPCLLKMIKDLLNDFSKLLVNRDRIVTVNPSDEIGTLPNVSLVLVAPLDPPMIHVDRFHFCVTSIARFTCFSWYSLASSPSLPLSVTAPSYF